MARLLRILSHPVLSAAGNVYTLSTIIPGTGSIVTAVLAFTLGHLILLLLAVGLGVAALTIAFTRFGRVKKINLEVEHELIAIIREGEKLRPLLPMGDVDHASYMFWRRKTVEFLMAVFGSVEKVHFRPNPQGLEADLERLYELLKESDGWEVHVDAKGLQEAAGIRRTISYGDRIALVDGPLYPKDEDD